MRRKGRRLTGLWFLLPSLLGVLVFVLLPFLDVVRRSFLSAVTEEWVGLKNYHDVLENGAFRLACWNTFRFTLCCLPVLIGISLVIGVLLQRRSRLGDAIKTALLFPMAVPVASIVLVWRALFLPHGLVNGALDLLSIEPQDWMATSKALWVLVGSYLWKNLGYDMVLWMAGLSSISGSIYEAASIDGAGEWTIFRCITLPCLLPTLFTVTVLSILNSFKVFREAYLVAGDYPHKSMYLLQHLFNNWFLDLSFDRMAAGAVLTALVILCFIGLLRRNLEQE